MTLQKIREIYKQSPNLAYGTLHKLNRVDIVRIGEELGLITRYRTQKLINDIFMRLYEDKLTYMEYKYE